MKNKKLSLVIVFAFLFAMTTLTFQNCSKVEFAQIVPEQTFSSVKPLNCEPDQFQLPNDEACQSPFLRVLINQASTVNAAAGSTYIVTLEKSPNVTIDSSYLEILSGTCVAKSTWQFPLNSWKLNGKELALGLNNWEYNAADHQSMGGCQWLGAVKGHLDSGKTIDTQVIINTTAVAPAYSCSATLPCNSPMTCTLVVGTPTMTSQAWVKAAPNCGFNCANGYSGATCATPPVPNSCATMVPCAVGTACSTTLGTPSSVNQAWVKAAPNCGFNCINGYEGATCATPPSCSASVPCTNGVSCALTTGKPTSVNQAWAKAAPNCGFNCINGYEGATCATPPSCSASVPCTNGVSCALTTGTPTSVNQAWAKAAPNCGFNCINGYEGATCATPPSCSTNLPCSSGSCEFTTGKPANVNQAWVKGAANCGYNCINGYDGATCSEAPYDGKYGSPVCNQIDMNTTVLMTVTLHDPVPTGTPCYKSSQPRGYDGTTDYGSVYSCSLGHCRRITWCVQTCE